MMKEIRLKYIFNFSSALLLVTMLFLSKNAGISCDEVLHYNHSVSVYKYFASHGEDKSSLDTPVSNLKYYGQSYDNLVTILIRWFNIEDVYNFRHIMSSIAGWLAIYITALFAVWLTDYRGGIIVLVLFALSPTFFGHAQNNLKDVPFALAYIASTFFIFRFLVSGKKNPYREMIFLIISIAFAISIRAGGLLLLCYLFLFFFIFCLVKYLREHKIDLTELRQKFFRICCITVISWFSGILLWPFALQSPVKNVLESYHVMSHYPSTFRQIFEGRVEWSDYMPWYYLPKSILITVPFVVLAGLILYGLFSKRRLTSEKTLLFGCLIFTVLFPVIFVIYERSNLYSSWRQFLFLYPGIILLASIGYYHLFQYSKSRFLRWGAVILTGLLSIHPLKFMHHNPQFYYLYYNQLVGGLRGAYANFETDYYNVGQTAASEWLIDYLKKKNISGKIKVDATYSVEWQFRYHPEIETSYFRFEERSQSDWDYAIVTNRYISPFQLRNSIWPPGNAIHIISADKIPVCAVLERKSKYDYLGYLALTEGRNKEAIDYYEKALKIDDRDEMIFYNFAAALYNDGQYQKADSVLKKGLGINPDFELILMYLGNIARWQNRTEEAIKYYETVIRVNRKYFEAYVGISELLKDKDVNRARTFLRTCLTINPRYRQAITALADTYRNSYPDIAKKYDDLANTIN
jgi:tetratricopeptide (TPR) repeat protein